MSNIVNKLIDVDREARQMLDDAQQYYERTLAETEEEKRQMRESYAEKARLHIESLVTEQAAEVAEAAAAFRERTATLTRAMEERYGENHTQWEAELVRRCIENVPVERRG